MACIYKATNKINGKCYIGYTKNLSERKSRHKSSALSSDSHNLFHKAIRKYGWYNFDWEIIYESQDSKHCLSVMEPHFITEYNSYGENGYNMTRGGERGPDKIKRKPLTDEQKRNISIGTKKHTPRGKDHPFYGVRPSEQFIQASKTSMLGKNHTDTTKQKQSESRKKYLEKNNNGMFGKTHSEGTKKKMSEKSRYSWALTEENGTVTIINNLEEYSKTIGVNYKTVYSWKYKTINGQPRLKRI